MIIEQSVDGINIARRSEACTERLHSQSHSTASPPHPQFNVVPGNIHSIREGASSNGDFNTAVWGAGGRPIANHLAQPNATHRKFRAIFLPSTVPAGPIVGGRKARRVPPNPVDRGPSRGPSRGPW